MASASFHMNVKTHADEAHNTYFDLQNSPYHTWPHPITGNYSFKYFPFLIGLNPSAILEILKLRKRITEGVLHLICFVQKNSHTIS